MQAIGKRSLKRRIMTPQCIDSLPKTAVVCCGTLFSGAIPALRKRILMWGENDMGKQGDGKTTEEIEEAEIGKVVGMDGLHVISLKLGNEYVLAMAEKDDSRHVWVWGSNRYGQHGNGQNDSEEMPFASVMQFFEELSVGVNQIAAGSYHCGAITDDDTLYMWGANDNGQCGEIMDENYVLVPKKVKFLVDGCDRVRCMRVCYGSNHCLAILICESTGVKCVMAWGRATEGQLGLVGERAHIRKFNPTEIAFLTKEQEEHGLVIANIGASAYSSFCILDVPLIIFHLHDTALQNDKIELFKELMMT